MLAKLKKLLAECHLTKYDDLPKVLAEASPAYLLQRAQEEIKMALIYGDTELDYRLKVAIQLLNMARYQEKVKNEAVKNQK